MPTAVLTTTMIAQKTAVFRQPSTLPMTSMFGSESAGPASSHNAGSTFPEG